MPRTAITPQTPLGPFPTLQPTANSLDFAMSAADTVNFNQAAFGASNRLLVLWQNTSGATPYTVTLTSSPDDYGRSGDITTYQLDANDVGGMIVQQTGWKQSDGNLYFQASNAAVKFAIIRL